MTVDADRARIEAEVRQVERKIDRFLKDQDQLAIVQAPPGSGKTRLLVHGVFTARRRKERVAVACQTNNQADDVCRRLSKESREIEVVRFASRMHEQSNLGSNVSWVHSEKKLPHSACIVVSTTAKWALTELQDPFDVLFVEEAWQFAYKDLLQVRGVAGRFVLIGDPGQIPPVITIETQRWATAPRAPHVPAPTVLRRLFVDKATELQLPATWRLPHDSATVVQSFYDFPFGAWAQVGDRSLRLKRGIATPLDGALDRLAAGSMSAYLIPTPEEGPPAEADEDVAEAAVQAVLRLLERKAHVHLKDRDGCEKVLKPGEIGLVATHRDLVMAMQLSLPDELRDQVRVDTAERWQGLERDVMIAIHPLSGTMDPSEFDLETGRICVMASRHRTSLLIVGRDHLVETLDALVPCARQPLGVEDITGRGHAQHVRFLHELERHDRIVRVSD